MADIAARREMHRNYADANKRSKRVEYGELVNAVVNFRSTRLLGVVSACYRLLSVVSFYVACEVVQTTICCDIISLYYFCFLSSFRTPKSSLSLSFTRTYRP
jgi:hypothetical protein